MDPRLHILEALYRFDLDEPAHMRAIQETAARYWWKRGPVMVVSGHLVRDGAVTLSSLHVTRSGDHDYEVVIREIFKHLSEDGLLQCVAASPVYGGYIEVGLRGLVSNEIGTLMRRHGNFRDMLGFYSGTQEGGLIGMATVQNARSTTSPRERAHWQPLAAHLATAWRLRQRLSHGTAIEHLTDAVFRPDGRTVDCCAHLNGPVRQRLREFVRKREAERTSRTAPREIWPELIDGQWTLVDHFESNGHRVVVALRNTPMGASLCRLTEREADALAQARNGASNKEIAINMALSESSVTRLLQTATRRLNATLADILQFSPSDTIKCTELLLGSTTLSMTSKDTIDNWRHVLSDAENSVVSAVLRGHSNQEIAAMRGRSVRTIANQIASAFEKLGVRSRREMQSQVSGLT
jgi:DNA-binding CsgD family transcriptional regulator